MAGSARYPTALFVFERRQQIVELRRLGARADAGDVRIFVANPPWAGLGPARFGLDASRGLVLPLFSEGALPLALQLRGS
jgi:hypothetical protein